LDFSGAGQASALRGMARHRVGAGEKYMHNHGAEWQPVHRRRGPHDLFEAMKTA
jgi:hypothetical protein